MPGRIFPLVTNEFYHLFNRGSDKRNIFLQTRDYKRFEQTFYYYQFLGPKPKFSQFAKSKLTSLKKTTSNKIIEIICYCLMPNHFHFLVRQLKENGISIFMSQISNSYTKYFNTKYSRVGPLLQGAFKGVRIETDEQLIHISRYIHLNPIVSEVSQSLEKYHWSSYSEFIKGTPIICSINEILNFFSSKESYKQFLKDQISYGKTLEILKHQGIDSDDH